MSTPYKNVTDRFLNKIKKDTSFFSYKNLTLGELEGIINQRVNILLDDAILELNLKISHEQKVDFTDKDDMMEQFNFDLTPNEEDLISDAMLLKYYQEELAIYKKKQEYLGKDIKVFSPAKERSTFLDMLEYIEEKLDEKIGEYNVRDRLTNKQLLPYNVDDFNYDF